MPVQYNTPSNPLLCCPALPSSCYRWHFQPALDSSYVTTHRIRGCDCRPVSLHLALCQNICHHHARLYANPAHCLLLLPVTFQDAPPDPVQWEESPNHTAAGSFTPGQDAPKCPVPELLCSNVLCGCPPTCTRLPGLSQLQLHGMCVPPTKTYALSKAAHQTL